MANLDSRYNLVYRCSTSLLSAALKCLSILVHTKSVMIISIVCVLQLFVPFALCANPDEDYEHMIETIASD